MKTMRDVAERAGVSATTVSLVLNGRQPSGGPISPETQQRVLGAAKELGYRRNALVQAVVSGHNRALGFLAVGIGHEFTARVLSAAIDEAESAGYSMQVLRLKDSSLDRDVIERCIEMRLAGLITVDINPDSLEYLRIEMQPHSVPIAFLDTSYHRRWGIHIVTDDETGCRLALEHLVALGHSRIGFLGGRPDRGMFQVREQGFRKCMGEMGLSIAPGHIVSSPPGSWDIPEAAVAMLSSPQRPTAVLCAADGMAVWLQRAARRQGLRLPQQLSIIGFADLSVASSVDPALTTVAQPIEEMGYHATRLLLGEVQREDRSSSVWDHPTEEILPVRLIVRDSTMPPQ
jgi:DNA-binding LacI/PurR family transcriptional regulator